MIYESPIVQMKHGAKGWFIIIFYKGEEYISDQDILKFLEIDKETYKTILMVNFKAEKLKGEFYFATIDKGSKAVEWLQENIDAFMVAKELMKSL